MLRAERVDNLNAQTATSRNLSALDDVQAVLSAEAHRQTPVCRDPVRALEVQDAFDGATRQAWGTLR